MSISRPGFPFEIDGGRGNLPEEWHCPWGRPSRCFYLPKKDRSQSSIKRRELFLFGLLEMLGKEGS